MRRTLFVVLLAFLLHASYAQSLKYPATKNSISLEFTAPVHYILDNPRGPSPTVFLPVIALTGEARISKKLYGEIGIIPFSRNLDRISVGTENLQTIKDINYTLYAGALIKFRLFNNFYFTPSAGIYFQKNLIIYNVPSPPYYSNLNENYWGIGATIGFEYFIFKRISVNTDLLSLSYGLVNDKYFNNNSFQNTGNKYGQIAIYKFGSLGIHYNFDLSKKH